MRRLPSGRPPRRLPSTAAAAALSAALLVAACGYRFQGAAEGLPGGIRRIAVPILENPTLEPELGPVLTGGLRDQLARTAAVRLVPTGDAEGVLRGRIVGFENEAIAFDASGLAVEYRATVRLDLVLSDPSGTRVYWADPGVAANDTYRATADPLVTEANRREAVRRIAADLGRSVRDRVVAGF